MEERLLLDEEYYSPHKQGGKEGLSAWANDPSSLSGFY